MEGDAALAWGIRSCWLRWDGGCGAKGVRFELLHLVASVPFQLFFPFAALIFLAVTLGFFAPGGFPLFLALDAEAAEIAGARGVGLGLGV